MSQDERIKTYMNGKVQAEVPDPEVVAQAMRRQFTAEYKLRILTEAEHCGQPGDIGALLRREGLYASHLTSWRRQRAAGQLQALRPRQRGRQVDPAVQEVAELRRENQRLQAKLERAETIIAFQKNYRSYWV